MKLSVDSKQRVTTTCLMFLEFYKILMATFLVLFVPQKCDEECFFEKGMWKRASDQSRCLLEALRRCLPLAY